MNHPRFSRELYDRHDKAAKDTVLSLLSQQGCQPVNLDEAYGAYDFIVETPTKEQKKVEVEQKNGWQFKYFPFSTLDVSHRKHKSQADDFYEVNQDGTAIAYCPMSVVHSSPVKRKNTCLGTINEPFFAIPISKLTFYHLYNGKWQIPPIMSTSRM